MLKLPVGFSLALALCGGFSTAASAQTTTPAGDHWDVRLNDFKGDVQIFEPEDSSPLPPEKGMPLEEGDRVVTGAGSSAELSLDGGGLLRLSALSDLTITSHQRAETKLKLAFGTFLAKIAKLLSSQSLSVHTPTAVAAVRGTEFAVEVDAETPDESRIGVFDDGKIEVRGQSGAAEILIGGQETKVVKGQAPLRAFQLERLARHRSFMRTSMRKNFHHLRKTWKAMSPQARRSLRAKLLPRLRERREERLKKVREIQENRKGAREKTLDRREKQSQKNREAMEKVREQFRRREERNRPNRPDKPEKREKRP